MVNLVNFRLTREREYSKTPIRHLHNLNTFGWSLGVHCRGGSRSTLSKLDSIIQSVHGSFVEKFDCFIKVIDDCSTRVTCSNI